MKFELIRRKDIAKLRAELNKIEGKKAIEKLMQLRDCSLKRLIKHIKGKKENRLKNE